MTKPNRPKVVSRLHAKLALDAKRLVINCKTRGHYFHNPAPNEGIIAHLAIKHNLLTEDEVLDLWNNPEWNVFIYDTPLYPFN